MNTMLRAASLVVLVWALVGCATTSKVDWDSRIGTYTFEQATAELGPPTQTLRFNDGTFLAEWIRGESAAAPPAVAANPGGYGSRGHWVDRQGMEALGRAATAEYLHLTFSAEERLLKWDQGRK